MNHYNKTFYDWCKSENIGSIGNKRLEQVENKYLNNTIAENLTCTTMAKARIVR